MTPDQIRACLTAIRHTAERNIKQIDGLLAMMDEEPIPQELPVDGCQHHRTVETPTLGRPGGKLCLDCDQNL